MKRHRNRKACWLLSARFGSSLGLRRELQLLLQHWADEVVSTLCGIAWSSGMMAMSGPSAAQRDQTTPK